MGARGFTYSEEDGCFYFPFSRVRQGVIESRRYSYHSLRQRTSREVVMVYQRPGSDKAVYFRHNALICSFVLFDGKWCLALTPHYVYTTDGRSSPYALGEELLSGMKRLEHQGAVLGQVLMWKHILTFSEPETFFDERGRKQPCLRFSDLLRCSCERSLDEKGWLTNELEPLDGGLTREGLGLVGSDGTEEWELF